MSGQKRISYTAGFKLKVIAFADQNNNSSAARHFDVNERQVREWRKKRSELSVMPVTKKAARGCRALFPALEEKLSQWVTESRQSGFTITRRNIQARARSMLHDPTFQPLRPVDFVASSGWLNRFMNRCKKRNRGLSAVSASSQPVQSSLPSQSRLPELATSPSCDPELATSPSCHPELATSQTSEMLLQPNILITSTLMQPVQNSATINSQFFPTSCELPSPRNLKSDTSNCATKQCTNMNMLQNNKCLPQQLREFKMLFREENENLPLKRSNAKNKRKAPSASIWKSKYTTLMKTCTDTQKLVQKLEQQVKTLEGELVTVQEENINMASVKERLESFLEKAKNDNVHLKQENKKLKSMLTQNANAHLKQVQEQLKSLLETTDNDDTHLKSLQTANASTTHMTTPGHRQASHSPEMKIKVEFSMEAADNHGGSFALEIEDIKQEHIYEEHPDRSRWKETSDIDKTATISQDKAVSMNSMLCGERCQMKAGCVCLDHGSPIYIDNAEVTWEYISIEDMNETVTAEEKIEQPALFSKNEDASSYTQLCYANSHAVHMENGTHQSTRRT